jgi:hypothetical protein
MLCICKVMTSWESDPWWAVFIVNGIGAINTIDAYCTDRLPVYQLSLPSACGRRRACVRAHRSLPMCLCDAVRYDADYRMYPVGGAGGRTEGCVVWALRLRQLRFLVQADCGELSNAVSGVCNRLSSPYVGASLHCWLASPPYWKFKIIPRCPIQKKIDTRVEN